MTPKQYRAARLAAGLSQQALADALGVDREIVNRREHGRAPIKLEAVLALSIVLEQAKREKATVLANLRPVEAPDAVLPPTAAATGQESNGTAGGEASGVTPEQA